MAHGNFNEFLAVCYLLNGHYFIDVTVVSNTLLRLKIISANVL